MTTLFTIIIALFSALVGAYVTSMYFNSKDKGYNRLPSYEEAKDMVKVKENYQAELKDIAKPVKQSTDPCDPNAYIIRHYRNGNDSTDAWVVCLREFIDADPMVTILHQDPYHEFEVKDYKDNNLPDFGGFEFVYVDKDYNKDYNVVGFIHKEDAESIINTIVETIKESRFSLVEE